MNHFEFGLAVGVMTKSANPGATNSGGLMGNIGHMGNQLMGAWNSMPAESRTAIAAGVPAALAGLYLHHRGNTTAGTGLGLAGLAAAGVGAAHAGMFGQGAQKFVAPHVKNISNMASQFMGGQQQNPMAANHEYGQAMQGHLENQLQNASATPAMKAGAYIAEKLAAGRCWKGYEPVPGKAPYSNDSCRPAGKKAKKKKTEEKTAAKDCGCTSMTETPSSRGTTKKVNDEQKSTDSPKPEDAGATQLAKASQAPVPQSVSVWGGTLPKTQTTAKPAAKPAIPKSVSAWGAAPSHGPSGYIDNQAARSWGGM